MSAETRIHQAVVLACTLWHAAPAAAAPIANCTLPDTPLLTVQAAISAAVCVSPEIRAARFTREASADNVEAGRGAFLPTLTMSLREGFQNVQTHAANPLYNTTSSGRLNVVSFEAAWLLFDFGSREARLEGAKQGLEAATGNVGAVSMEFVAGIADVYRAAQYADASMRLETAARDRLETSMASVTKRVDSGIAPISEQRQLRSELLQAEIAIAKAESDAHIAREKLARLLASTAVLKKTISPLEDAATAALSSNLDTLSANLQALVVANPRFVRAVAEAAAARSLTKEAKAAALPSLRLTSSAEFGKQPLSPQIGYPSLDARTRNLSVALVLNVPLFSGYVQTYTIRKAEAEERAKAENLEATRRDLMIGIQGCIEGAASKRTLLERTRALRENSDAAYRATLTRYSSGVGSINELISSIVALDVIRRSEIRAQLEFLNARTQCVRSIGNYENANDL